MSWFYTGKQANKMHEQEEQLRQDRAANRGNRFFRFYLKAGNSAEITFLDSDVSPYEYNMPFMLLEHQLNRNGSWMNWYTCIQNCGEDEAGNTPECPICAAGERPHMSFVYSIIDHSEYKSKSTGEVHKDLVKLLVVKSKVHKLFQKQRQKRGELRGLRYEISRMDEKSPNSGDVLDFIERVELDPEIKPPNFLEIFAPKPISDLKALVGVVEAKDDRIDY